MGFVAVVVVVVVIAVVVVAVGRLFLLCLFVRGLFVQVSVFNAGRFADIPGRRSRY